MLQQSRLLSNVLQATMLAKQIATLAIFEQHEAAEKQRAEASAVRWQVMLPKFQVVWDHTGAA